jgi:quinol monooxygenase YgiN
MNLQPATSKITSVASISARPVKRKELVMTIAALLEPIRHEQGCRAYRFFGVTGERDSFVLIGEWETLSDWDRHMHSEHFAILLGSLELLSDEKRLEFKLLSPMDATIPLVGAMGQIG